MSKELVIHEKIRSAVKSLRQWRADRSDVEPIAWGPEETAIIDRYYPEGRETEIVSFFDQVEAQDQEQTEVSN